MPTIQSEIFSSFEFFFQLKFSLNFVNQNNHSVTLMGQLNDEQQTAVINMLCGNKNHLPHLLIGPPGKS